MRSAAKRIWPDPRGMRTQYFSSVGFIGGMCVIGVVTFFATKADVFLFRRGVLPVQPSTLFVLVSAPLVYFVAVALTVRDRWWRYFLRCQPMIVGFLLIVVVGLIGVFPRSVGGDVDYRATFLPVLDFYVFVVGILVAIILVDRQRLWGIGVFLIFAITISAILIDTFLPGTFSISESQAAGFGENPNVGALIVLMSMIPLLDWSGARVPGKDAVILLGAMVGILATFSRAGIMLYLLTVTLYLVRIRGVASARVLFAIVLAALCVTAVLVIRPEVTLDEYIPVIRAQLPRHSMLLGNPEAWIDSSAMERLEAIELSVALIAEAPLLGHGSGYIFTMNPGPHNMYVARWIDNGVFGFVAYVGFLVTILLVNRVTKNREGEVLTLVVIIFGVFSHNVLEERPLLLLLAISTAIACIRHPARLSEALSTVQR